MEVKIYVDVLFIINFIIDYILLSVTSFLAKKSPAIFKMCISSSIGALFSAVAFFMPQNSFFLGFMSILTAFLMVFIAFGVKKTALLVKDTAIFYLVCICTSGIGFSVVFSGKMSQTAISNGIFYADINAYTMLLVFILSILTIHTATGYIKKQKIKSSYIYNVTIERNGKTVCDAALFDTGNFLRDPISQKSVIIAEWQSVAPLFDEAIITEAIVKNPKDFLYIACNGIAESTGMYAFSPDKVTSPQINFCEPVFIAITEKSLDKEGSYRIILPNSLKIES